MRFCFLAALALIVFPSLSYAGFVKDNCDPNRGQNRVRADIVFDLKTGTILSEKNADTKFHPASLSKLMSLIVIFDAIRNDEIQYSERIQLVRTAGNLDNRSSMVKSMSVKDAVNGVVTGSLNNALDGVANKIGMAEFVNRMNTKAKSLGLTKTKFVNPTGWPTPHSMSSQRTSLNDLATLLRHLETEYHKEYSNFDGKSSVTISGIPTPLKSTNNLLQNASSRRAQPYKGVVGGKTGYTCYSGWHLITLYKDDLSPSDRLVLMTVSHDTGSARDNHMRKMLDKNIPKYREFLNKRGSSSPDLQSTEISAPSPSLPDHPRNHFEQTDIVRPSN
jgi:D-alanyl-D-alanine carboxypeptidase